MNGHLSAEARTFVANPESPCDRCGHILGPHVFFATDTAPDDLGPSAGGMLVCPQIGCTCALPWGTAARAGAFIPSAEQLDSVRQLIQHRPHPDIPIGQTYVQWQTDDPYQRD